MNHRFHLWRLVGALALIAAIAASPALPIASASAATPATDPAWLVRVNQIRTESGLPVVTNNAAWSTGISHHLTYMESTPASYETGQYASAHTENPASPYYTADGAQEAGSSDLAYGSPSDVGAIDEWLAAPFHAIGMLRPRLQQVAFARDAAHGGYAGLDVIRGLGSATQAQPVLYPGPGATTYLRSFGGEVPSPLETCGWTSGGLPLIALLPQPPKAGLTATLHDSGGHAETVCVVDADTYHSTDPVYGPTGLSILQGDNAVLVISKDTLAPTGYTATISQPGLSDISWSFGVDAAPSAPAAPKAVAAAGKVTLSWTAPAANGSPITGYDVSVIDNDTVSLDHFDSTTTTHVFTGFAGSTTIGFSVDAVNAVGPSPASPITYVTTPATVPGTPTGVRAIAADESATVAWTAPAANGSAITQYVITPLAGTVTFAATTVSGSVHSARITHLVNGTSYSFTVSARNGIGLGGWAQSNVVTPEAPTITAKAIPNSIAFGATTVISGTVTPAMVTPEVVLQRRINGKWYDRNPATVGPASTYALRIKPSGQGIYALRLRSKGGSVDSPVFYLRVR